MWQVSMACLNSGAREASRVMRGVGSDKRADKRKTWTECIGDEPKHSVSCSGRRPEGEIFFCVDMKREGTQLPNNENSRSLTYPSRSLSSRVDDWTDRNVL